MSNTYLYIYIIYTYTCTFRTFNESASSSGMQKVIKDPSEALRRMHTMTRKLNPKKCCQVSSGSLTKCQNKSSERIDAKEIAMSYLQWRGLLFGGWERST